MRVRVRGLRDRVRVVGHHTKTSVYGSDEPVLSIARRPLPPTTRTYRG